MRYIKQVKIDILTMLADFNSASELALRRVKCRIESGLDRKSGAEHIVMELSEYVTEVDVEIARRAIRAIGSIAAPWKGHVASPNRLHERHKIWEIDKNDQKR